MGVIEVEWEQIATDLVCVGLAFALALPIAWERGRGRANVGLRTLPIVANGGLRLRAHLRWTPGVAAESQARVLQGIITGIGFVGGGAIDRRAGRRPRP